MLLQCRSQREPDIKSLLFFFGWLFQWVLASYGHLTIETVWTSNHRNRNFCIKIILGKKSMWLECLQVYLHWEYSHEQTLQSFYNPFWEYRQKKTLSLKSILYRLYCTLSISMFQWHLVYIIVYGYNYNITSK